MKKEPWVENAPNLLIVNTIFAALSGILIGFLLQDAHFDSNWMLPLVLLVFSFWSFALSAERITDAIDERSVKKYVAYMPLYNLAVSVLFYGTSFLIHYRYSIPWEYTITIAVILSFPWLKDTCWLFVRSDDEFRVYLQELQGEVQPTEEKTLVQRIFYAIRGILHSQAEYEMNELPHQGVYTRLKSSPIHGVGVFAIRDIPKDTLLFSGDNSEVVWIDGKKIPELDSQIKKLYDDFCIIENGKYGCPKNFNQMTISWYLNESKQPNVRCGEQYEFYALRDIQPGEELTVDYSTYSVRR